MQADGYAAATRRVRVRDVAAVARWAGVPPERLTVDHVRAYFGTRDLAAWTRRKYLEHLRAFARFAGIADPTEGIRAPRQPRGTPRPVTESDLGRLLATGNARLRAWVLLGAFCGLRSAEIAAVTGADFVDGITGSQLRVRGKGGRRDVLPCPPVVDNAVRPFRRVAGDGRLWPEATAASVQRAIRRLGERAGVDVTSHQLRHRYGTALYAASGGDVLLVQRLMRHASPVSTAVYVQVADADAHALANALPGASGIAGGRRERAQQGG